MGLFTLVTCAVLMTGNDNVSRNYTLSGRVALEAQDSMYIYVDFSSGLSHNNFKIKPEQPMLVPKESCWTSRFQPKEFPENEG